MVMAAQKRAVQGTAHKPGKVRKPTLRYDIPVQITTEGKFYIATCPNWDAIYAQDYSVEHALSEFEEVAGAMIAEYKKDGLEIPLKIVQAKSLPRFITHIQVQPDEIVRTAKIP